MLNRFHWNPAANCWSGSWWFIEVKVFVQFKALLWCGVRAKQTVYETWNDPLFCLIELVLCFNRNVKRVHMLVRFGVVQLRRNWCAELRNIGVGFTWVSSKPPCTEEERELSIMLPKRRQSSTGVALQKTYCCWKWIYFKHAFRTIKTLFIIKGRTHDKNNLDADVYFFINKINT